MKSLLIALFLCLIAFTPAKAQHNKDDRYFRSAYAQDTIKAIRKQRYKNKSILVKRSYNVPSRAYRAGHTRRFIADAAHAATLPIRRMSEAVIHAASSPAGCPRRSWCGCWLAQHLGMPNRSLWLARNWAGVGSPASASPGAIVVWRHHVGRITAVDGHRIRVLSGNDGRRVRERWRSMAGVIAFRQI